MLPKVGDKVQINPEWIKQFNTSGLETGSYTRMERHGFCVGAILLVTDIEEGFDDEKSTPCFDIVVEYNRKSDDVWLLPDGRYKGELADIIRVPFFINHSKQIVSQSSHHCPICGSSGDDLVFDFYCYNENCQNYRFKT